MHRIYKDFSRPLRAAILILAVSLVVTGCSLKTVYNRLDYLLPEYVEGLVTLDDVLEERLEERTSLLVEWHRSTQLEQYADWFRRIQADTGPQLDAATLEQRELELEAFWRAILQRINTEMAELLPMLSAAQREELFASLEQRNREYYDDYVDLDDEERREDYIDRVTDTYENWLGDLTEEQELAIENAALKIESGAAQRLELRKEWQRNIRQILESDIDQASMREQLLAYFERFDVTRDPVIRPMHENNKRVLRQLALEIVHSMTDEQRDHFKDKTDDYIRMFTELAENR